MRDISQVDGQGYWTGQVAEIDDWAGVPLGWVELAAPTVPNGKLAIATGGEWLMVDPPAADMVALRAMKLAALIDYSDQVTQTEFAWDFGATATKDDLQADGPAAGPQTLQMRVDTNAGIDDPKNWLGVGIGALGAEVGGAGASVIPIKATSNLWVQTTAAQLFQVLVTGDGTQTSMLRRQSMIVGVLGAFKARIKAAADPAALDAIDITAGWPV